MLQSVLFIINHSNLKTIKQVTSCHHLHYSNYEQLLPHHRFWDLEKSEIQCH